MLTFNGDREKWEQLRDELHEAEIEAVGQAVWETNDPDRLWREDENFRKAMRPILADVGETAQFLAMKGLVLNSEATALFLNFFYDDLAAALKRLMPQADGDYSPDEYRKRFPKSRAVTLAKHPRNYSSGGLLNTRALQAYLGHRNIQHTVRYTELSEARFRSFWKT